MSRGERAHFAFVHQRLVLHASRASFWPRCIWRLHRSSTAGLLLASRAYGPIASHANHDDAERQNRATDIAYMQMRCGEMHAHAGTRLLFARTAYYCIYGTKNRKIRRERQLMLSTSKPTKLILKYSL